MSNFYWSHGAAVYILESLAPSRAVLHSLLLSQQKQQVHHPPVSPYALGAAAEVEEDRRQQAQGGFLAIPERGSDVVLFPAPEPSLGQ